MVPLHQAARSQLHMQPFIDAARAGEDLERRDEEGQTPLHHALACVSGTTLTPVSAIALLALGASPDLADGRGVRPLHHAARGAKLDLVRLLLALGADRDAVDADGRSPLAWALEGARRIPQHTATVAGWLRGEPLPPLRGRLPTVAGRDVVGAVCLLREGAAADARDAAGRNALHLTVGRGLFAALLALGADPNGRARDGQRPLHVHCRGIGPEIRLLVDNGADASLPDGEGRLPVEHLRAQHYPHDFYDGDRLESARRELVRLLEGAGA